jgi:hypothetical protein
MPPFVTQHAVSRYQERVEPVSEQIAREVIEAAFPAIAKASEFGCPCVVLGNGARLMLQGDVVATVLPKRFGRKRNG